MVAAPIAPKLANVALVSIAGGFVLGLLLVHLIDALDDRFRSMEEMQDRLGLTVLSMVQRMKSSETKGLESLTVYAAPTSAESESFRTLRTALGLTHSDARQIVVTSPEPGDGKTTVLANLAVAFAQANKRTLLVDADLRRPGLSTLMGMRGPLGLSEVLRSEEDIAAMVGGPRPGVGRQGARHPPLRTAAAQSRRVARQPAVLAVPGLGRDGLRPDSAGRPAGLGHQRRGADRPPGGRRDARRCSRPRTAAGSSCG